MKTPQSELELLILEQQIDALNKPFFCPVPMIDLIEAGLEEPQSQPLFGFYNRSNDLGQHEGAYNQSCHSVVETVMWFSDNQDARWEAN